MWIVCITSVRHVLTVNGYGGRQTKENEKSWCFKGWETLVNQASIKYVVLAELRLLLIYTNFMFEFQTIYLFDVHSSILKKIMVGKNVC